MSYDLQQFRETYITECFELLADMEERLMRLDDGASIDELNAIFRCAHSIKGGAGAFGFTGISKFTHILETLLDDMREGKIDATREVVDTLLKSRDVVVQMVVAASKNQTLPDDFGSDIADKLNAICGQTGAGAPVTTNAKAAEPEHLESSYVIDFKPHPDMLSGGNEPLLILRELASLGEAEVVANTSKLPPFDRLDPETSYLSWRVHLTTEFPMERVMEVFEFVEDACDLMIEETTIRQVVVELPEGTLLSDEPMGAAHAKPPAAAKQEKPAAEAAAPTATSIRVDIEKVDRLINMVGEVVIIQAMLADQTKQLTDQEYPELKRGIAELLQHTRELQESVMAVRMQPVKSIFSRMPRIVRDLCQQLGKDVELAISGELTEVDKTIIEQLSDPLTHMIRNAVDHGMEMPEERMEAGKPRQGTIRLNAEHRGGRIVIEVADDGPGIKRERVLKKAREKGIVAADATPSDSEIDHLLFAPGFSTAEVVSNVSGRGVGMDVVKRNIEALGGSVSIQSETGKGSLFTIALPLTLAILDGMIVRVAGEHYIIPINNIIETMRPQEGAVQHVADGTDVLNVRGEFVPILYLYRLFGVKGACPDAHRALVVLVESGRETVGLVVDELVGQQQVVIKSLEENTDPIAGISGATILGDGKVSLILDTGALSQLRHPVFDPLTAAA